ncbi:MAG: hypothetical protein HND48_20225 [Chloroflexi bacterium]|nr:hypothetical protein [Chloroflexota bacterium]
MSYPLPGTPFYERVKLELGERANWVDSEDLAMLYRGPFTTVFYRQLHTVIHKEYRARKTWAALRARPARQSARHRQRRISRTDAAVRTPQVGQARADSAPAAANRACRCVEWLRTVNHGTPVTILKQLIGIRFLFESLLCHNLSSSLSSLGSVDFQFHRNRTAPSVNLSRMFTKGTPYGAKDSSRFAARAELRHPQTPA